MATNQHKLVLPLENTILPVVSCSLSSLMTVEAIEWLLGEPPQCGIPDYTSI